VLANIAAIRIEQARLAEIEQAQKLRAVELEQAARIQRSILPSEFPPFPDRKDFELHAAMVPAKEVGGDLFDFFLLDDEHLAFVIGDVSGKGIPAALFMAMTRSLLRATAPHERQPGRCLNQMNTMLAEGNTSGMFVTLFYGVLDTRTGALEFANAGHNPPYILSTDGKLQKLSQRSGPMLGVLEVPEYQTFQNQIPSGAAILLYTDGITEAVNTGDEFFDDPRLEAYLADHAAAPAQSLVAGLHAAVQDFSKGAPQADDITVLALRYVAGRC
jgi:phosphoserine phosphatase RsbU/P